MSPTSANETTDAAPSQPHEQPYTAVVYFHGMGNQRRYEEMSSLLNQLDNLVYQQRGAPRPSSLDIQPIALERDRSGEMNGKEIAYYEVRNPRALHDRVDPDRSASVRFYEAYWANYTAGGTNPISTLLWVVRQWRRPLAVLWAAWGEVSTLRVGTLYGMYEQRQAHADRSAYDLDSFGIRYLIEAYRRFVRSDARYSATRYRGTSFADFRTFLNEDLDAKSASDQSWATFTAMLYDDSGVQNARTFDGALFRERALALARSWWWADTFAQIRFLTITVSLLVILVTAILAGVGIAYRAICFQFGCGAWPGNFVFYGVRSTVRVLTGGQSVLLLLLGLLVVFLAVRLLLGLKSFFSDYMGDVQNYLTYQETDVKYQHREAILNDSKALMRHVMKDKRCERIVVVAHSLGSVIAYDTLLGLRRRDWVERFNDSSVDDARTPIQAEAGQRHARTRETALRLDKVKHFVTMGSPIDKVVYFFAALQSQIPQFVEAIAALRGSISEPPFTWTEKIGDQEQARPSIHWVNYWDRADLISGPIRNIVGTRFHTERVDNVRVASLWVPNPALSHGGYFDHRYVLQDIFDIVFENKFSFVDAANKPRFGGQRWFANEPEHEAEAKQRGIYAMQRWSQRGVVFIALVLLLWVLGWVLSWALSLIAAVVALFVVYVVIGLTRRQFGVPQQGRLVMRSRYSVSPQSAPVPPRPVPVPPTPEESLELLLDEPLPEAPRTTTGPMTDTHSRGAVS